MVALRWVLGDLHLFSVFHTLIYQRKTALCLDPYSDLLSHYAWIIWSLLLRERAKITSRTSLVIDIWVIVADGVVYRTNIQKFARAYLYGFQSYERIYKNGIFIGSSNEMDFSTFDTIRYLILEANCSLLNNRSCLFNLQIYFPCYNIFKLNKILHAQTPPQETPQNTQKFYSQKHQTHIPAYFY